MSLGKSTQEQEERVLAMGMCSDGVIIIGLGGQGPATAG
jgi:hypothetical protein